MGETWLRERHLGGNFFMSLGKCAQMSDLVSSGSEPFKYGKVGVLGVARDTTMLTWQAVQHDRKQALLYKYIKSVGFLHASSFADKDTDVVYYPENIVAFTGTPYSCGMLDIRTTEPQFVVCGKEGSVVRYNGRSFAEESLTLCTLYDLLIYLCRATNLNVMRYNVIQIGCQRTRQYHIIRFIKTTESERFFAKMFLDVTGDYKLARGLPSAVYERMDLSAVSR